jgi:hypothetical protein
MRATATLAAVILAATPLFAACGENAEQTQGGSAATPCPEALDAVWKVELAQRSIGAGLHDDDGSVRVALRDAKEVLSRRAESSPNYNAPQYNSIAKGVVDQIDPLIAAYDRGEDGGLYQVGYDQARRELEVHCGWLVPTTEAPPPVVHLPAPAFTPEPTTTTPSGPADTIPTGTHVVGVDILPGTYRTTGPVGDVPCYWERLSDLSGEGDAVIANDLPEGPTTVTIKESDAAFATRRCALWTKVD